MIHEHRVAVGDDVEAARASEGFERRADDREFGAGALGLPRIDRLPGAFRSPLDSSPTKTSSTTHFPPVSFDRRKEHSTATSASADEPCADNSLMVSGPRVRGSVLGRSRCRASYSASRISSAALARSILSAPSAAASKSNSSQLRSPLRNSTARHLFALKSPARVPFSSSIFSKRKAVVTAAVNVTGVVPASETALMLTAPVFSAKPRVFAITRRASFSFSAGFGFFGFF